MLTELERLQVEFGDEPRHRLGAFEPINA